MARISPLKFLIGSCLVWVCAAGLMIVMSCTDDDPIFEEDWDENCRQRGGTSVGPEGGMVPVDDYYGVVDDVTVEVVPDSGDFWGCFTARVTEEYNAYRLPGGFRGFREGYALDLGYFREYDTECSPFKTIISIPVHDIDIDPEENEILCAFRYDDIVEKWFAVLPAAPDTNIMIIETVGGDLEPIHSDYLWSWGVVALNEVDYDETLKPMMEEMHGKSEWASIESMLQDLYHTVYDTESEMSCATIYNIRDVILEHYRSTSQSYLETAYDQVFFACGPCPFTSRDFMAGLATYLTGRATVWWCYFIYQEIAGDNALADYILQAAVALHLEIWSRYSLQCSYTCVFELADGEFWANLYTYYFATIGIVLIDAALDSGDLCS